MDAYVLKQDYQFGINHSYYNEGDIVSGNIDKDGNILEVPIYVNCYNPDNSFGLFLNKIPISILIKIDKEESNE